MSKLQLQQEDHPAHGVPKPTEDYHEHELPVSEGSW